MDENEFSFRPIKLVAIFPAVLWASFFILFFLANDYFWAWGFFLGFGAFALLPFLTQWRIYTFNQNKLSIAGPLRTQRLQRSDIVGNKRRDLAKKNITNYTWILELRNGKKLSIMTHYMKDGEAFREAFESWLNQAK